MIRAVLVTSLQEMSRRITALVFILLLPLAFYLVRIDVHWQAIRFLSIGIGWAVATLSLFTFIAARDLDRRLVVAGASPSSLFAGRLAAVLTVGLGLAVIYFGVVALTLDDLPRVWSVLLLLVVTVLKLHGDEECAVAAVGGLCLGMIERASATDWMIIPDFQPKLGVQGCRVKVRGGLGREPPAGVLAQCGGLEPALRTERMATSHKPPQPCTSLWTRPVDNSATT